MVNVEDDTQAPRDKQSKRAVWKLTKKKAIWLVGIIVVIAVAAGVFAWYQGGQAEQVSDTDTESRQADDGPIIMTIEERYRFENIKRAEGVVKKIDGDNLAVEQSDGKAVDFQLIKDTQYVRGEQAYAGDKQSVTTGKKVSISYDQNNMYVQTIWVDYDVASSN